MSFEVDDPMIKHVLQKTMRKLTQDMPPGYGITLFIVETGVTNGAIFYASSCVRNDMIKAVKEWLRKQGETEL